MVVYTVHICKVKKEEWVLGGGGQLMLLDDLFYRIMRYEKANQNKQASHWK